MHHDARIQHRSVLHMTVQMHSWMHLDSAHKHCSRVKLCCANLCVIELYEQNCSQVSSSKSWMTRLLLPVILYRNSVLLADQSWHT